MHPLVSIIIPTYNRAHLIGETLDSILAQTYPHWECIIVSDGSKDHTDVVVGAYVQKDARFRYYHRPDSHKPGGNGARNYGFEVSRGEYVKWFDSDDIMKPVFLENQVNLLSNNPTLDFCSCQFEYFTAEKNKIKNISNTRPINHPLYALFLESLILPTPAPLWRKSFLDKIHINFNEDLFYAQESDFNVRVMAHNPIFKITEDFDFLVRRGHPSIENSSTTDLKSKISSLYYFENSYQLIRKTDFDNRSRLLRYLLLRILSQSLMVMSHQTVYRRIQWASKTRYWLFSKELKSDEKTDALLAFWSFIIFKKGYRVYEKFKRKIGNRVE